MVLEGVRKRPGVRASIIQALVLTVLFPVLLSLIVYYGFASNYSSGIFNEDAFRQQYEQGLYKYRVVGRFCLIETYKFLESDTLPARIVRPYLLKTLPAPANVLDSRVDSMFYAAYFIQNTVFLILASIVLWMLLRSLAPAHVEAVLYLLVMGVLLMTITGYVVCPYDSLSYFLILLSFYLILRPFPLSYWLLLLVLAISTLTRESSALTMSFFFAHHFRELIKPGSKARWELAGLVVVYCFAYLSIRLLLPSGTMVFQSIEFAHNLQGCNLAGDLALPIVAFLICSGSTNLTRCLIYILAGAPYVVAIMLVGITWEMRLWVPVWLGLLCLRNPLPEEAYASRQPVSNSAA